LSNPEEKIQTVWTKNKPNDAPSPDAVLSNRVAKDASTDSETPSVPATLLPELKTDGHTMIIEVAFAGGSQHATVAIRFPEEIPSNAAHGHEILITASHVVIQTVIAHLQQLEAFSQHLSRSIPPEVIQQLMPGGNGRGPN